MGIRVIQRAPVSPKPSHSLTQLALPEENPPHAAFHRFFWCTEGKVKLEASLDKAVYSHGDSIHVNVSIINDTKKIVKHLKVLKNTQLPLSIFIIPY